MVLVELSDQDDTFQIKQVGAKVQAYVFGGAGDDTLNVTNDDTKLDDISGIASFFGQSGNDTLNVYGDSPALSWDLETETLEQPITVTDGQTVRISNDFPLIPLNDENINLRSEIVEYIGGSDLEVSDWETQDFLDDTQWEFLTNNTGELSALSVTGMGMGTNNLFSVHNDFFGANYSQGDPYYRGAIYFASRIGGQPATSTVEQVHVYLGDGDDVFDVDSTYAGGTSYVHGG